MSTRAGSFAILCLAAGSVSHAAFQAIQCDHCPPRPAICDANCIYLTPEDYVQNAVRRQVRDDPKFFNKIEDEASRRRGLNMHVPLGPLLQQGLVFTDIKQQFLAGKTTKKGSKPVQVSIPGATWINCGPTPLTPKKSETDRKKDEITKAVETTTTETTQTNISLKVGGSIKFITAEANVSITDTLQKVRRESTINHTESEQTNAQSLDLTVPPYSMLTWTITEEGVEETIQIDGVVITDAAIAQVATCCTQPVGRWSDFVDEGKRQLPVVVTAPMRIVNVIYHNDTRQYPDYQTCNKAATKS